MIFYPGLHQPADARYFDRCMVSLSRLQKRVSDFPAGEWIMDSMAYTELNKFGAFRLSVEEYAARIDRWSRVGKFLAASPQDYMCEPWVIAKTGLSVREHQRLTVERYHQLHEITKDTPLLIVIQGYRDPAHYIQHLDDFGRDIPCGAWVGIGSICRLNTHPELVEDILLAIKRHRRDLRLHGFGLKKTALRSGIVREALHSADSMAWSYAARRAGRNANDWREAKAFEQEVITAATFAPYQDRFAL
jgi:hypothetical protein